MQTSIRDKQSATIRGFPCGSFDQAVTHAKKEYPRESCGVITVDGYTQLVNMSESAGDTFETELPIDCEILAVVHSHPDASPEPSHQDRIACAATDVPWLILACPGDAWELIYPPSPDDDLIGRVFVHGSHDCWGVVHSWYRQQRSIELANPIRHDGWWDDGGDMYQELLPISGFDLIGDADDMAEGDVILMQIRSPVPNHAGVYIGNGKMIHHLYGRESEEAIYGGMWEKLTVGVWRYVA